MELHSTAQTLAGVAVDHVPGLVVLALLPLLGAASAIGVRLAARRGAPAALLLVAGWSGLDARVRLAALLMAATAAIHFGLIPTHAAEAPVESILFLLNGCLFLMVVLGAVLGLRFWRPLSAILLVATILAYGLFVVAGREQVDDLGVVTKLIELVALGLVVMPHSRPEKTGFGKRAGWAAAGALVVLMTTSSGALAWAAGMRDGIGSSHQPLPSAPPTIAERMAAQQFADQTWADISPYQDVSAALAAGYRPTTPPDQATAHYMNARYQREHPYMDPKRPQGLVYTNGAHPVLLGAMYELGGRNPAGNSFGGVVTGWHRHENVCVSVFLSLGGVTSPFGNCPPLNFNITTSPMLHVWRPENPRGQFGELDEAWARRLAARGMAA